MRLLVILVSKHKQTVKVFDEKGEHLLSNLGAFTNGYSFVTCTFEPGRSEKISFEQFIAQGGVYEAGVAENPKKFDGVLALYEEDLGHLLSKAKHAIFAAQIQNIKYLENVQNFLTGQFSVLLKNYRILMSLIQDSESCQAASLPIKNFDAEEFRELLEICSERSLGKNFQNEIIPGIKRVLKLRGPKRRSKYPDIYFKDSKNRYFNYGKERHARYETGGDHTAACVINACFRLGKALEQDRHFNVSMGDSDAGSRINAGFPNCHGDIVEVKNRTHINMFSNDYFT